MMKKSNFLNALELSVPSAAFWSAWRIKGRIKAALVYCIIYLVLINSSKSSLHVFSISFLLRGLSWPMIINSKVWKAEVAPHKQEIRAPAEGCRRLFTTAGWEQRLWRKKKRGMKARGPEIQRMRGDWIMRRGENKVKSEDILIFIPVFEDELPSGLVAQRTHTGRARTCACARTGKQRNIMNNYCVLDVELMLLHR